MPFLLNGVDDDDNHWGMLASTIINWLRSPHSLSEF